MRVAALELREGDHARLSAWTRSSTVKAGLAARARIVLLAADGVSHTEIAHRVGVSRPTVTSWRRRYASAGSRGSMTSSVRAAPRLIDHAKIVAETLKPPRKKLGVTHWSTRLLAARLGIDNTTVARAWRDYGVQPWRAETTFLHRPRTGRQGHRRGRSVLGATGERDRAVCRRKIPDPGIGSDTADVADETRRDRAAHP